MKKSFFYLFCALALGGCGADNPFSRGKTTDTNDTSSTSLGETYFENNVRSIVQANCACHSSYAYSFFTDNVTAGDLDNSLFYQRSGSPHNGGTAWSDSEREILANWINGATE